MRLAAATVLLSFGTGSAFAVDTPSQSTGAPAISTPSTAAGNPTSEPEQNLERNKNAVTDTTGTTNTGTTVRLPPQSPRTDPGHPTSAPEINVERNKNAVQPQS